MLQETGSVRPARAQAGPLMIDSEAGPQRHDTLMFRLGVRVLEGEVVAFREVAILSDQTEYSTVTGLGETEVVIISGGDFTRAGQRVEAEIQTDASVKAAGAM